MKRPNLVFLLTDDQAQWAVGAYGNDDIHTPNMDKLAEEGISVEVIDLRTLKPLDLDTVLASVKKTGRVIGVTEAYKTGSFISELAMCVQEQVFDWLDAPIVRVAAADVPIPMAETLENAAVPNVEAIIAGIRKVLR